MMTWSEKTTEEALAAWDAGESVWSCEMGGMGPGYEQCIQILVFEMLRAMAASPMDWERFDALSEDEKRAEWEGYWSQIESAPEVAAALGRLSPSGAQLGAAVNLASVFSRQGYEAGMEMVPEDRRIQVSKEFPA